MKIALWLTLLLLTVTAHAAQALPPLVRFAAADFTGITDSTLDRHGNIYICGVTKRPERLPGSLVRIGKPRAGQYDAFVIKLRADGTPAGTALIGGKGYDAANRIAVDSDGNIIITGTSGSLDFPVVNPLHAVRGDYYGTFVCKLDASLSRLVFSTFVNEVSIADLAVDAANNILVAGMAFGSSTASGLFPPENGYWSDAFVLKLRPNGRKDYATRLHAGSAYVRALAVDAHGIACIVGDASYGSFPLLNAVQPFKPAPANEPNAFLARIDADGQLISSTFLGSSCRDSANAVAVNAAGEIYVAGETSSEVLPASIFDFEPCDTALRRGFLIKLDAGATNVIFSKVLSFGWHHSLSSLIALPNGAAIAGGTISSASFETGVPFLARFAANGATSTYFPNVNCEPPATIDHLAFSSGRILFGGYAFNPRPAVWNGSYVKEIELGSFNERQPRQVHIVSPPPFHFSEEELPGLAAVATGFNNVDSITFYDGKTLLGAATNAPFMIALPALPRGRHTFTAVARGDGISVRSCSVRVTVGAPPNDDFTNRIQIAGRRVRVRGTTTAATVEAGESYLGQDSVWYSWRPPRDGAFEFQLMDESQRAIGAVFTGDDLPHLTELESFSVGAPGTVVCEAGKAYQIRIATYSDSAANFRLVIRAVERPSNDDFADAQIISGVPASVNGTATHATAEEDGVGFGNAVWYSWTAPASGLYLASTTDGVGYVSVFTGTTLSNLVERGQPIYGLTNGSAFYAGAGETYFLAVTAQSWLPEFTLTIQEHQPPVNDNFAQRILIPAGTMSATGSCLGATYEIGESPSIFGSPFIFGPTNSVWWKWVAPGSGVYRAEVFVPYPPPTVSNLGFAIPARPGIGDLVSVYSGDALGALTQEDQLSFYSRSTWRAEAGVEYQLKVSGGAALFTLDIAPVPTPANDNFADAIMIDGFAQARGTTEGAGLEPDEPQHSYFGLGSVWYRWVAPGDGLFVLDTQASAEIFTGDILAELVRVTNSIARIFRATAGAVYSIAVLNNQSFSLRIRPAVRPPNDDFAQRQILAGLNLDFTANLHDATVEPEEPNYSTWEWPFATAWYSWTAPTNGNFLLRATNNTGLRMTVYTGDSLTNLTLIRHTSWYQDVDFQAVAGTTYHFSIDNQSIGWMERFAMQLRYRTAPSNDDFANRSLLTGTNASIAASNTAASVEPGEPEHSGSPAHKSVWFSWTAPMTGRVSFELLANFSAVLTPYTGTELTNLVALLPGDYYRQKFNFNVEAGATYQLAVDGPGYPPNEGAFTLNIRYASPPPNDLFAARLSIATNEVAGTLEGATRELGEPGHGEDPNGNSVWWTWTAPTNGIFKLQVPASESLEAAVFTGTNLQSLQKVAPSGAASYFYFAAQTGVTYTIQVSSRGAHYADYRLLLEYLPPPPNDDFENRIPFTSSISGTLEGATREADEPNSNLNTNKGTVWFAWTAPEDGLFELKETARSFVSVRVFQGSALSNLQAIASTFWDGVTFTATAGTVYAIQVGDYDTWSGASFALSIRKTSALPPPPTPLLPKVSNQFAVPLKISGNAAKDATSTNLQRLIEFTAEQQTRIQGAAIDDAGNVFVHGDTSDASEIPGPRVQLGATANTRQIFLLKLAADGTLLGAVTFGGEGVNSSSAIALDSAGRVVIVGTTSSTDFPLKNPLQSAAAGDANAFVCKFDASGTNLLFSALLGGGQNDTASSLAVAPDGSVFVSGTTSSEDFQAATRIGPAPTPGSSPSFVVKLRFDENHNATIDYSTMFGGSAGQTVTALTADTAGHAYVAGHTSSFDFPVVNALQPFPPPQTFSSIAYIAKLTPDGTRFVYATYLAGECQELLQSIAVNAAGEALIVGASCSEEVPALAPDSVPLYLGYAAFAVKLSADGSSVLDRHVRRYSPQGDEFKAALPLTNGSVLLVGGVQTVSLAPGFAFVTELSADGFTPERLLTSGCDERIGLQNVAANSAGQLVLAGVDVDHSTPRHLHTWVATIANPATGPQVRFVRPANGEVEPPSYGTYLVAAAVGFSNEVTSMEFYEGTNLIGVATNVPFQIAVPGDSRRTRSFWARASSGSESATSCVVRIIQKAPPNDTFARRRRLFGERVRVRGTTQGATPDAIGSASSSSVWYSWRAPRDGTFEFSLTPEERAQMAVFTGRPLGQWILVSDWMTERDTLRVQRGALYYILVGTGRFGEGKFELAIRPVNSPPNDDFTNATVIAGTNVSVNGTLLHATPEQAGSFYSSVWYRWQAPNDGLFFVSATSDGAVPLMAVNREATPYSYSVGHPVNGVRNGVAFQAERDATYSIAVYGYNSSAVYGYLSGYSNFTLTVTAETPPTNDVFQNSIIVSGTEVSLIGSTLGSTNAGWYSWTAPTSGVYRIAAPLVRALPPAVGAPGPGPFPGSGASLSVHTGNTLETLTFITGGDIGNGAALRAIAGVTYHIAVPTGLSLFELQIHPVQVPPNDDYANATLLSSGTPVIVTGSTRNATPEPGSTYTGATVWYRWIAPSNGLFTVEVLPSHNAAWIYSGNDLATAELLHSGGRPLIRATAGQEFRIGIPDIYSSGSAFLLRIEQLVPVANDDFANSEVLTGTNVQFVAHVRNATAEPDEYWADGHSVWFTWTAPVDGQFWLRFTTPYSAVVRIFVGDALTNLMGMASSELELYFNAQAGTTYRFQVDDPYHYGVDLSLELSHVQAPSNDSLANRIALSGAMVSTSGTLRGATIEPDEPRHGGPNFSESVWWSWTAPRTGRAQIDLSRPFWAFAYTGDSLESLNQVAAGTGLDFSVEAGVTYQIVIADDIGSTPGDFQLQITLLDAPSNDDFANRRRLIRRARGTTDGASREVGEPYYDFDPTGGSVWYVWRAPRNGLYDLVLTGGSTTTATIYTGNQLDELMELEETAGGGQMLRFHATRGTTYAIEISSPNNSGGPYQLEIIRRRPPTNDDFADRIQLTGTNFTVRGNNAFATREPEEQDGLRSLWWKWIPPTSGSVFIQFDEGVSRFVTLYSGNRLDELEYVAGDEGSLTFDVVGGVELQIAVDVGFSTDADEPWRFHLLFVPSPANDNFVARIPLAGTNVQTTGTLVGASTESWDLPHSVWWSWVVPATGSYTFRVKATNTWPEIQLYSGTNLDDVDFIAAVPARGETAELSLALVAGQELAILVGGWFETPNDHFEFTITKVPAPPNDDFANRAELIDGRGLGTNEGASSEPGEFGTQYDRFGTLWWRFTAASNGWHTVAAWLTNSANEVFTLRAYPVVGDNVTNLSGVRPSERHYQPRYFLTAGTEYSIQIYDAEYRFGTVALEVNHIPSPANDFFTNATLIADDHVTISASNGWASVESRELPSVYSLDGGSVWWRWTPPGEGVYFITTDPAYIHDVGVFIGTTVSNLTAVRPVAYGAPYLGGLFRVRGGIEHYVQVASDASREGAFVLHFDRVQPPPNDDFTNRTVLSGSHISINASNHFATPELGDPLIDFISEQTVWWSWTAQSTGRVSVTVGSTNFTPLQFRIFTGTDLTNLTPVTTVSYSSNSFNAEAGVEYQIGVTTTSYYATDFRLKLDVLEPPPLPLGAEAPNLRVILPQKRMSVIETSTDLLHWQPYRTNALDETNVFITPRTDEPQRFFRVR